jgi:hypothetical protein
MKNSGFVAGVFHGFFLPGLYYGLFVKELKRMGSSGDALVLD